jgi:hypothetical protein
VAPASCASTGLPPTGKSVTYGEIFICRFAGGRIAETWVSLTSSRSCDSSAPFRPEGRANVIFVTGAWVPRALFGIYPLELLPRAGIAVERRTLSPGRACIALRRRVSAPPPARALALRAVAALRLDLAGVDIAIDRGRTQLRPRSQRRRRLQRNYADDVFATAAATLLEQSAARRHSIRRMSTTGSLGTPLRPRAGEAASRASAGSALTEPAEEQIPKTFERTPIEPRREQLDAGRGKEVSPM